MPRQRPYAFMKEMVVLTVRQHSPYGVLVAALMALSVSGCGPGPTSGRSTQLVAGHDRSELRMRPGPHLLVVGVWDEIGLESSVASRRVVIGG